MLLNNSIAMASFFRSLFCSGKLPIDTSSKILLGWDQTDLLTELVLDSSMLLFLKKWYVIFNADPDPQNFIIAVLDPGQ